MWLFHKNPRDCNNLTKLNHELKVDNSLDNNLVGLGYLKTGPEYFECTSEAFTDWLIYCVHSRRQESVLTWLWSVGYIQLNVQSHSLLAYGPTWGN